MPPSASGAVLLASAVLRQSLAPMVGGYLLVMVPLGLGLLRLRHEARTGGGAPRRGERPSAHQAAETPAGRRASGWPALLRHMAGTAAGGYLLLMVVVFGYYYAVARVGGHFLVSAITGPALLIGLTMPLYAATAWLLARRRRGRRPGPAPAQDRTLHHPPGPSR